MQTYPAGELGDGFFQSNQGLPNALHVPSMAARDIRERAVALFKNMSFNTINVLEIALLKFGAMICEQNMDGATIQSGNGGLTSRCNQTLATLKELKREAGQHDELKMVDLVLERIITLCNVNARLPSARGLCEQSLVDFGERVGSSAATQIASVLQTLCRTAGDALDRQILIIGAILCCCLPKGAAAKHGFPPVGPDSLERWSALQSLAAEAKQCGQENLHAALAALASVWSMTRFLATLTQTAR